MTAFALLDFYATFFNYSILTMPYIIFLGFVFVAAAFGSFFQQRFELKL